MALGVVIDKTTSQRFRAIPNLDGKPGTYVAEVMAIREFVYHYLYTVQPPLTAEDTLFIMTSTPAVANHLNGDTVPLKTHVIKLLNELEALQESKGFSIAAKWVTAAKNPAQQRAHIEKRQLLGQA